MFMLLLRTLGMGFAISKASQAAGNNSQQTSGLLKSFFGLMRCR